MARVEICGGIGAGKSSCATVLSRTWHLPLVQERFEDIPYWKLFYRQPEAYALEKDLSFLLSHADSMRSVEGPRFLCDFAMFQTIAYSQIAGNPADTQAVELVYQRMTARVGHPGLLLRLRCDMDVQMSRIRQRGRRPELGISRDYLARLDAAIDVHIQRLPPEIRIIEIDTTTVDAGQAMGSAVMQEAMSQWLHG